MHNYLATNYMCQNPYLNVPNPNIQPQLLGVSLR